MEITKEEIAQNYKACLDSVNLINVLKKKKELTEDEADTLSRNKAHLNIMLNKDYWIDEDLQPLKDATL